MIRSMTGYGKGIAKTDSCKVTIEMKSVNHRYLDLNIKLPRKLNFVETSIRNTIGSRIVRGKVDVFVSLEEQADAQYSVSLNEGLATMYRDAIKKMSDDLDISYDLKASSLSRFPDVLEVVEADSDESELNSLVNEALNSCIDSFITSRENEGTRLKEDLVAKLDEVDSLVTKLEARSPVIIEEYKGKLLQKVADLLADNKIDEGRIAAEVVLYADKVCIDEEMVRLKSHVKESRSLFENGNEIGRRMDFLAQEMNRESNTILSKSTDVEIADIGISLKTLIEKIREQIQNIE